MAATPSSVDSNKSKCIISNDRRWDPAQTLGSVTLVQLGDILSEPGYHYEKHMQFCHELFTVCEGEMEVHIENKKYQARKGDVFLLRYGTTHEMFSSGSEPARQMLLGFFLTSGANKEITSFVESKPFWIFTAGAGEIPRLFEQLFAEIQNMAVCYEKAVELYIELLLLEIFRMCQGMRLRPYHFGNAALPNEDLVEKIGRHIREHALDMSDMEALSEHFRYSYSYLTHLFSNRTGCSLREYRERCKYALALEMMADHTPLTSIAQALKYSSIHTFSRAFRLRFGVPPSSFRRRLLTSGLDIAPIVRNMVNLAHDAHISTETANDTP